MAESDLLADLNGQINIQLDGVISSKHGGLKTVFDTFDRDKNGTLDATEMKRVFSDTSAVGLLQNGFYTPSPGDVPTLGALDADGDGRVSFAEYVAYYRQAAAGASQAFPPAPQNQQNVEATEGIFALLDRDKDGRLTRAEVAAQHRRLERHRRVSRRGASAACALAAAPGGARGSSPPHRVL